MAQRRRGRHLHIDLAGACLRAASTTYSLELDADTGSSALQGSTVASWAPQHIPSSTLLCETSAASLSSNARKSCETTQQHHQK